MQSSKVLLVLFALQCGVDAHPIGKVIEMLEGLSAKAEAEGKEEALAYEKFEYWCKNSIKDLSKAIAAETASIESLEDQIASARQNAAQLTRGINALEAQLGELDTAASRAKALRKSGKAVYDQAHEDLSATISAVGLAISGLEGSAKGASFVQVLASPKVRQALLLAQAAAPDESPQAAQLAELLQEPDFKKRPEFEAGGDAAAHVSKYDFKSGDIIETLKTLRTQFEDELLATVKAETNAINAYDLAKQERDHVVATSQASLADKQSALSDVNEDLVTLAAELEAVKSDKAADEASLDETSKACQVKKQEWEQRSAVRTGEIEAIGAAVKILAEAAQVRTEAPGNPVPPPSPAAFLQTSARARSGDPRVKALNLLRSTAHRTHSHALERLAQELSMHLDDPFQKVTNMIEKMIFHLMDEQRQEDEHKAWCDQELSHNNASKVDKEDKIEGLTAKIESADAMIVKLSSDIGAAQAHIAAIVSFMEEATEIREIGKKENALALADAQQAQASIADATSVIESFYKESGMIAKESWEALVQQRAPAELSGKPDTWGSSYTGVAEPENQPGGIITVLQQVASEFAMMEADTRAQEATDQAQFEEEIKENTIAKAERQQEVETKDAEKNRQVGIQSSLTANRKRISDELEKVNQYLHDLIPACGAGDSTYEDRKAARTEETEALRQAQNILAEAFKEGGSGASPAPAAAGTASFRGVRRHA